MNLAATAAIGATRLAQELNRAPAQQAKGGAAQQKPAAFTDKNLYQGSPKPSDIKQDALGDCYFVSSIGSLAQQQPEAIRKAITYDAKTQSYNVTLYERQLSFTPLPTWETKPVTVNVTQADLQDNLKRQGGSTVDNSANQATGPLWPAVLETAYAKHADTNHADGLKQGYDAIGNGGWSRDAMFAVTGKEATTVNFNQGVGLAQTREQRMASVYGQVETALKEGRPVTLEVHGEADRRGLLDRLLGRGSVAQDSLVDNHAYMVERVYKDAKGQMWAEVRNPWGHNNDGEGTDTPSATTTVKLDTLYDTGSMDRWGFNIGGR